ncbi:hypothetical protein BZARG_2297 [Bizionia argentinensis JUB59]|uniref:Lysoplasmalogenase n=1 Tax=Bizionia argentinensis JUB59 TaxID=1046627 RepID=G2EGN9_9FLAO|nr:hypothetical protein BZARG_2297 [Bizionia argentinensis JUB59]
MKLTNIIIFLIIVLCVAFAVFQFNGLEFLSISSKSLIVPLFTLLYFINVRDKPTFFTLFLLTFSITELSVFAEYATDNYGQIKFDLVYILGNILYIIAYCFLIAEVFKTINVRKVLKKYLLQIIVLMALNIYIAYMLIAIVNPKFMAKSHYLISIELLYNVVMLLLLMVSLISYFYNDNKKTLLVFLGSICIVFSEVIQIAYFYITDHDMLNILQTLLFVVAFAFFYFHSTVKNRKVQLFMLH